MRLKSHAFQNRSTARGCRLRLSRRLAAIAASRLVRALNTRTTASARWPNMRASEMSSIGGVSIRLCRIHFATVAAILAFDSSRAGWRCCSYPDHLSKSKVPASQCALHSLQWAVSAGTPFPQNVTQPQSFGTPKILLRRGFRISPSISKLA